ncbi:uncharacterized protein K460DRAFT_413884 [Cucurbitaria berberidis CBS 394.84]|uniref:CCHC-type domain-containing protein n=1 Tax=Cucurbitaria berberidis CBS 394.84 TaxID=1168544 RepID=A0A9P4GKU1_9PLEO|nr:uncharacterized protein K460DRAFT_413884 [Cucurbitaria berberidis CBS 394.84]KAF1847077.1 hypothetical protein K460DRAFT_413884 [Cucurbitaria berberidis CBS 394.84]
MASLKTQSLLNELVQSLQGSVDIEVESNQDSGTVPDNDSHSFLIKKLFAKFQAMERTLQRISTTLRLQNQREAPKPEPFALRYSLKLPTDVALVKSLKNAGIVEKFNRAGAPFDQIRACKIVSEKRTLVLYIDNAGAERLIHEQLVRIGEILNLSPECGIIREKYLVHVYGFQWDSEEFKNPQPFIRGWGVQNNVDICKAYWTNKKLILEFDQRNHAERLVRPNQKVYLSGYYGWAEPIDKRSLPKLCFRCAEPGHLKDNCNKPLRCQNCSGFGHQQWGCKKDPKCPNCKGSHPAWAPQCQAEPVLKMLAECTYYREKIVYWAQEIMQQPTTAAIPVYDARDEGPKFPHTREKQPAQQKGKKKASKKRKTVEKDSQKNTVPVDRQPETLYRYLISSAGTPARSSQPPTLDGEDIVMGEGSQPMIMEQPFAHSTSMLPSQSTSSQPTVAHASSSRSVPSHTPVKNFTLNGWDPQQNNGPRSTRQRTSRIPKENNDPSQTTLRMGESSFQTLLRETTPGIDMTSASSSDDEYETESESETASNQNYEGRYEGEIPIGK